MELYDLLSYINSNGSTIVIVKTKGDDGIELGSNRPHEEFPEFTWNKEIDYNRCSKWRTCCYFRRYK